MRETCFLWAGSSLQLFNLTIVILVFIPLNSYAQLESRYNFNTAPTRSNPATTGTFKNGAANFNVTVGEDEYYIIDANYHTHLAKSNSGLGLAVTNTRYESYSIFNTGLAYSYQSRLSNNLMLSAGISGFYTSDRDDFFPEFDTSFFSFDGGILLYSEKLFLSLSAFDFRGKNEQLYYSILAGYSIDIDRLQGLSITPVIGITSELNFYSLHARMNAKFKEYKFTFGGGTEDILTGLGYENQKIGLHYLLVYTRDFALNNRFSLMLKLPRSINRNTNSFDFSLF